jgi:5-methylcytosine-specific restriction protein A
MPPTEAQFEAALFRLLSETGPARSVEIEARQVHRIVGSYPDPKNHRMPICCRVMRAAMRANDAILYAPPKGDGATLRIRYELPR